MSIEVNESNYLPLLNNHPSYQAMSRVSDTNNIYDVRQDYFKGHVKNPDGSITLRNDFESQLKIFNHNKGLLCDGKAIDKSKFFTESTVVTRKGVTTVDSKIINYFKFKTNAILNFNNSSKLDDTYITKTKYESIYEVNLNDPNHVENDYNNNGAIDTFEDIGYGLKDTPTIIDTELSSYPLQRLDRLVVNELPSLFIYANGLKIPDNEIFVYSNKSFTDVFVPEKYLGGDINDPDEEMNVSFYIDVRQSGSEGFYYRDNVFVGNKLTINLEDPKYRYDDLNKEITVDKLMIFIDGKLVKANSVERNGNVIDVNFDEQYSLSDLELYILNDLIYRYKKPEESMLNPTGSKLHFYLNDDYYVDSLCGPLTKTAVSFYYQGIKIPDDKIIQTSRFSYEYQIDQYKFIKANNVSSTDGKTYYELIDGKYVKATNISPLIVYYERVVADKFDENQIDFLIEDIGLKIDDITYSTYGDDYYLLNTIGVKRCVDQMKGTKTYSIYDKYNVDFRKILSNNGELFDVDKALIKYTELDNNTVTTPESNIKNIIKERPTLLRKFLEQLKCPSKQQIVLGNDEDLKLSSIPGTDVSNTIYYKIYINHRLVDSLDCVVEHMLDHDIITVPKSYLEPLVKDDNGNVVSGVNEVEMFQYDLTYKGRSIVVDNVLTGGFVRHINSEGVAEYTKIYNIKDLNFAENLLADDICAVEKVCKEWYDKSNDEYYLIYPTSDNIGYRMVKNLDVEIDGDIVRVTVSMHNVDQNNGEFLLMYKQYNVVESVTYINEDNSYMTENDLMIPINSTYTDYKYDSNGNVIGVNNVIEHVPFINNSEPIVYRNGKELIYGKDYTYINPQTNDEVTSSYIVLKNQTNVGDRIICQFNSNKTNILIVGYDDLDIDNRYGLVYLSELKYPVSPEYMNIYVNGEKMSKLDMDILSDKLVRFHHMTRPIRTILITTNMIYKESEIQDYLDCYHESEFEKLLEEIFWNCDPSKIVDANKPNINYVYKMNPYYSDFVGDDEENYNNEYYDNYVNEIIKNRNNYNQNSNFELEYKEPIKDNYIDENDSFDYETYDKVHEAWENAKKFFNVYKWNHGFVEDVDSVKQRENPLDPLYTQTYITDTLEIMYLNWLANSGKTRTYGFKAENIDPIVLKYFSVYENVIIDNRIDIVYDSNRFYEGLMPDVINQPIKYDEEDPDIEKPIYVYPGAQIDLRRRYFYSLMMKIFDKNSGIDIVTDPEINENFIIKELCNDEKSNILYPDDFPLEPDRNGIRWTGTDVDIINGVPQIDN